MIAGEQLQKAGLGAGRALAAMALEVREAELNFRQVEDEIVGPEARPFPDRRRLGRLEMREGETR